MTLKLTPEVLAAAYEFLCTTDPFKNWGLPDGDEIVFKVAKSKDLHGWHTVKRGKHHIAISAAGVGHTTSLIQTMAHEMIHLYETIAKLTPSNVQHGAAFKKLAARVCRIHGFDPKTF
jgi:hypothetical protein